MSEKVILKTVADSGKKWENKTIFNVELSDGRKGSSFDEKIMSLPKGTEVELDVKEGKEYQGKKQYIFNLPKSGGGGKSFAPKDVEWEKRNASLMASLRWQEVNAKPMKSAETITLAEIFYQYIIKK